MQSAMWHSFKLIFNTSKPELVVTNQKFAYVIVVICNTHLKNNGNI